ncbi:hypothetical protein AB852_35515 [Streptomyces uncialis]|uniref:Uncharacterized protein n=1 Tax=Streptomyces uncialis TaxID=1048205 RepID=A0A1Q4UY51_9ACTN|nr:hypothetical protein AB852_35515 [Streptomyces uncialis]
MTTCARLVGHFRGLTWADVRALSLRDFNTLTDQMVADLEAQQKQERRTSRGRSGGSAQGERRTPVMT